MYEFQLESMLNEEEVLAILEISLVDIGLNDKLIEILVKMVFAQFVLLTTKQSHTQLVVSGEWSNIWKLKVFVQGQLICRECLPYIQARGPFCLENLENSWHALVGCEHEGSKYMGTIGELDLKVMVSLIFLCFLICSTFLKKFVPNLQNLIVTILTQTVQSLVRLFYCFLSFIF